MRTTSRSVVLLSAAFAWLLGTSLLANDDPTQARGLSTETAFQIGDIDSVNLFNGNLTLGIPIGQRFPAGGSLSYQLTLVYNSKLWDWETQDSPNPGVGGMGNTVNVARIQDRYNAGLGWSLGFGRIERPNNPPNNPTGKPIYVGPDGASHTVYETLHRGEVVAPGVFYTRDGSYLRIKVLSNGWLVEHPNGEQHTFDSEGRLTRIEDRFNNFLAISYPHDLRWELTDTFGRMHVVTLERFNLDGRMVPLVTEVDLAGFAGQRAEYLFEYETEPLDRSCEHSSTVVEQRTQATFLSAIVRPDTSRYSSPADSYHRLKTEPLSCHGLGTLQNLALPTGGSIAWTFGVYKFPSGSTLPEQHVRPGYYERSPGVVSRSLIDPSGTNLGAWTYSQQLDLISGEEPIQSTTTVIDPLGHKRVNYFSAYLGGHTTSGASAYFFGQPFSPAVTDSGGRFLSRQIYDGTLLKRSIYVEYERDGQGPGGPLNGPVIQDLNQRLAVERTFYHGANDEKMTTYSSFDGLGHYRHQRTDGDFAYGNVHVSRTEFNPDVGDYTYDPATGEVDAGYNMILAGDDWVLNTFSESYEQEAGLRARKQYCFDPETGFLLRERTYRNFGDNRSAHDVVRKFTADIRGHVVREESFGADLGSVEVTGDLCVAALGENRFRVDHVYDYGSLKISRHKDASGNNLPFRIVDRDIDFSTGLPTVERDVSGLITTLTYDTMGRITRSQPESGEGAIVTTTYHLAGTGPTLARAEIRSITNPGGMLLAHSELTFDGFGRVAEEADRLPGNLWSRRATVYDALGQVVRVSEKANSPSHWTSYENYDPFGRVRRIVPPEGTDHEVTVAYSGDRFVYRTVKVGTHWSNTGTLMQTDATTTEEYDRQGRLFKVTEPGNALEAEYQYDVGHRLKKVILRGTTNQSRTFAYDARGFLTSETHPESGSRTYSLFDTEGNPTRVQSGISNLTYAYDRASRLTSVHETGSGRPWREFTYATANTWGHSKGRLRTATRHNWIELPSNPGTIQDVAITEEYEYEGRGGLISQRDTHTSSGPSFGQSWEYDGLGNVTKVIYPRCGFAPCSGQTTGVPAREVSKAYALDWLVAVPGYASSLTYHSNGMIHRVAKTNGVTVVWDNDPWDRHRPLDIRTEGIGENSPRLGTHLYDGAGNVVQRGVERYTYDRVSRIRSFDRSDGAVHAYSYDSFGNLNRIDRTESGATTTQTMSISPSTNRLTAAAYDGSGNMVAWGGESYRYDALGMLQAYNFPEEAYIYGPGDERIWTVAATPEGTVETWTLRGLDNEVLTIYENRNGAGGNTWEWKKDYVYRDGLLLAAETSETGAGGRLHYALDHLGTPRLTFDASKNIVAGQHYWAFGEEQISSPDNNGERIGFTGHETDQHAQGYDLNYMHARFYNPHLARFLSPDPVDSGVESNPQSWNQYSYALNNPLSFTDPDGELPNAVIGGLIGGAVGGGLELIRQVRHGEKVNFRKVASKTAKGAVIGAVAGATLGGSLLVEAGGIGLATVAGGVIDRAADGDDATKAFSQKDVAVDLISGTATGALGYGTGQVVVKKIAGSTTQKVLVRRTNSRARAVKQRSPSRRAPAEQAAARATRRPHRVGHQAGATTGAAAKVAAQIVKDEFKQNKKTER